MCDQSQKIVAQNVPEDAVGKIKQTKAIGNLNVYGHGYKNASYRDYDNLGCSSFEDFCFVCLCNFISALCEQFADFNPEILIKKVRIVFRLFFAFCLI